MAPRGRGRRGRGGKLDRDGDVSMGTAGSGRPGRPQSTDKGSRTDREGDVTMGATYNGKSRRGRPDRRGGRNSTGGGISKKENKFQKKREERLGRVRLENQAALHDGDKDHKRAALNSVVTKDAQELKEKFRSLLDRRYSIENKLLDLSKLGQDPELKESGLFDVARGGKIFLGLMTVCDDAFATQQQKKDSVQSITIAHNELINLKDVVSLAQTFPDLKNLDLSGNKFQTYSDLGLYRRKFKSLEQIYLGQCPLTQKFPDYRTEIAKWYPNLLVIDGLSVSDLAIGPQLPAGYGAVAEGKSNDQVQKEQLEVELMRRTYLKLSFAQDCLRTNDYVPERAWAAFEQAKSQLGPEAFFKTPPQ